MESELLKMFNGPADPHCDRLRAQAEEEEAYRRKRIADSANDLAEALSRVHVSFLLLTNYEDTLQKFCIQMSSTPDGIMNNSWRTLAIALGYNPLQVECVKNTGKDDFMHMILKSYATKSDATLGDLIKAMKMTERLDAFTAIQKDLEDIAAQCNQNEDSGFSSADGCQESSIRIIYPPEFHKIQTRLEAQIPITIKELRRKNGRDSAKVVKPGENLGVYSKEENRVQAATAFTSTKLPPRQKTPQKTRPRYNVFLTFAQDGAEVAKTIAKTLRTQQGRRPQIGVLILEEQRDKVEQNPERFIMHYFEQMNFIVPILTEGYMEAISGKEEPDDAATLDSQYAQYIHDLSNKYYMRNQCLNDKIRCIVPLEKRSILNHKHRKLDPIMKAYEYDTNVEQLARRITRTMGDEDD